MVPKLSILMPVWNGLPYIREAVESVLAQDFSEWEMIIGDNGSTDGTRLYLSEINDVRIRVHEHIENIGIYGNLNFLFSQATAPICYILCSDDFLIPGALHSMDNEWKTAPDCGFIRFNWLNAKDQKYQIRFSHKFLPRDIKSNWADLVFFLFGNVADNLSNVSVKSNLVGKLNGFRTDLPYTSDFEFWSRLAAQYPFRLSDTTVSHIRRHSGVASNYLNKHGEYVHENYAVAASLFNSLKASGHNPWLLRLFATSHYDALQRDVAVRTLILSQKIFYMREVDKVDTAGLFFNRGVCWLIYFLTLGGRWTRTIIPRLLLRGIHSN